MGYNISVMHENVLQIDAVPEELSETKIIKFFEELFEILDYRTEKEFMEFYTQKWNNVQNKSRFDYIYKMDVEQLIKEFSQLGFPEYLPNGKRCYYEIPMDELKNKF